MSDLCSRLTRLTLLFASSCLFANSRFLSSPLLDKSFCRVASQLVGGLSPFSCPVASLISIVLNVFRSCYLNRWFCKLGPGQHSPWLISILPGSQRVNGVSAPNPRPFLPQVFFFLFISLFSPVPSSQLVNGVSAPNPPTLLPQFFFFPISPFILVHFPVRSWWVASECT